MTIQADINPEFKRAIRGTYTTDPAHPDTFNPNYKDLLNNTVHLKDVTESLSIELESVAGTQEGFDSLSDRLASMTGDISTNAQRIAEVLPTIAFEQSIQLDWLYRDNRIFFDFFDEAMTLQDGLSIAVIQGVAGDDSLDIADTSNLYIGQEVLITNGQSTQLVKIANILSSNRVQLAEQLNFNADSTYRIASSSLNHVLGGAEATTGDQYITQSVNLTGRVQSSLIIRRTSNESVIKVYARPLDGGKWVEFQYRFRRDSSYRGVPSGFYDDEYIIDLPGQYVFRFVAEGDLSIKHMVVLGVHTGLGGEFNPALAPLPPTIIGPLDGALNVGENPTIQLGGYVSPVGTGFSASYVSVYADSAKTVLVASSGRISSLSFPLLEGLLAVNTQYTIVARFEDADGLISDPATSTFTTAATFISIATPSITSPQNSAIDIGETPTIQTSPFAVINGTDTHIGSRYQVRLASSDWSNPLYDSGTVTDLTSFDMPQNILEAGETGYAVRTQHQGQTLGWSDWSQDSTFATKAQFANIIGIALVSTGGGSGTWQRINENFEPVTVDASFFAQHATYAGIIDQTIDAQAMVKAPKFFSATGTVPSGSLAGKKYWMISDQPASGLSVHPAFMNAGSQIDQFWVGKYQGTDDGGTKLGSQAGATPLVSIDFTTMQARANARNVGGVSGFMMWSAHQVSAIKTLGLIFMGGSNSQALIGQGNINGSSALSVSDATVAQATLFGIVGLWGNVWQMFDGLQTDANKALKIWDNQGNKTYITTSQIAPANGWPIDVSNAAGASYNLGEHFVASTTSTTETSGTLADYQYFAANCVAYHGGFWGGGSGAGLFNVGVYYAASSSGPAIGSRLAKV